LGFPGLHWIRCRQRALAKGVLALFCLVWLQAALVPCAMAYAPQGGMAMGAEEHCVYCPESAKSGDAGVEQAPADCLYPDGAAQVDTRVAFVAALAVPLAAATFLLPPVADGPVTVPERADDPAAIPRPPLAVSYCRYLK
jgi:hypothetical protein